MYKMTITVEDRSQVEDILAVLSDAEEEGDIRFPFGVETRESIEIPTDGFSDPTDTFGNEGRN